MPHDCTITRSDGNQFRVVEYDDRAVVAAIRYTFEICEGHDPVLAIRKLFTSATKLRVDPYTLVQAVNDQGKSVLYSVLSTSNKFEIRWIEGDEEKLWFDHFGNVGIVDVFAHAIAWVMEQ
jgi:hypothetical protein